MTTFRKLKCVSASRTLEGKQNGELLITDILPKRLLNYAPVLKIECMCDRSEGGILYLSVSTHAVIG